MLADPHTLVLDEATSLIDPRAARHLERSLAAVLEGRTVIAIAHRLFSAHDADRVAVVEDGRITELGSPRRAGRRRRLLRRALGAPGTGVVDGHHRRSPSGCRDLHHPQLHFTVGRGLPVRRCGRHPRVSPCEEVCCREELASLLPFVGIALLFWLLMIRPAQRRQREVRQMQSSLEVGDEVMLTSGIYGVLRSFADDRVTVEVAPGVIVDVARGAIGQWCPGSPTTSRSTTEPDDDPTDRPTEQTGEER